MSEEYRNEIERGIKEARWTFRAVFLKLFLPILAVLVIVGFILQATGIISIGIEREIRQHSQPYVETKVSLLHKLHTDWLQLESEIAEFKAADGSNEIISAKKSQQKEIIIRMHEEAELIPTNEVPRSVKEFLEEHPIYPK